MTQRQLEAALYARLQRAENELRTAINFSNACLRTFYNISIIARSLENSQGAQTLIAVQDSLQSFLILLRDNVNHYRLNRDQLRRWYRLRLSMA